MTAGHLAPTNWVLSIDAGHATHTLPCQARLCPAYFEPRPLRPSGELFPQHHRLARDVCSPCFPSSNAKGKLNSHVVKVRRQERAAGCVETAIISVGHAPGREQAHRRSLPCEPLTRWRQCLLAGSVRFAEWANKRRPRLAVGVSSRRRGAAGGLSGHSACSLFPCALPRAVLPISAPSRRGRLSLPLRLPRGCRAPAQSAGFSTTPSPAHISLRAESRLFTLPSLTFPSPCLPLRALDGRLHSLPRPGVRSF